MNDEPSQNRPYANPTYDTPTNDPDVLQEMPILALEVDDKTLIQNFKRWETEAIAYWNDPRGYDLEGRRNRNENYYLGRQLDTDGMYDYQAPFIDNQIFVGTEAVAAFCTARTPAAEIMPENSEVQSQVVAQDLENACTNHSEKFDLKRILESSFRNMYLKLWGIIKLEYDPYIDDIVPRAIDPRLVVVDPWCQLGDEPLFLREIKTCTVATLMDKFPDKKDAIMKCLGRQRTTPKLMNSMVTHNEVWFTQFDGKGESQECVAWYFRDILLDKIKNPNFLYDGDGVQINNFLNRPTKPYVYFNYMNGGGR